MSTKNDISSRFIEAFERLLNENKITYEINSKTLGSFLSTADDLIASEIVVEKILDASN